MKLLVALSFGAVLLYDSVKKSSTVSGKILNGMIAVLSGSFLGLYMNGIFGFGLESLWVEFLERLGV